MIISEKGDYLILVHQDDHGVLAGELVRNWGNDLFEAPQPLESVYHATRHHDRGWKQADILPLYDPETKRPRNFLNRAAEEHVKFYGNAVDEVIQEDPYAGLLMSMHWTGLYRSRWGMGGWRVDAEGEEQRYLDSIVEQAEARWPELKRLAWDPTKESRPDFEQRLWHNYKLLQCWDQMSLFVARRYFEMEGYTIKSVPTRVGGQEYDLRLEPLGDGRASIDPFPFRGSSFVAEVKARQIPNRDYASQEEVAKALADAEPFYLRCEYVPAK